jgi:ferredoxin-type protein NapH
MSKQSPTRQRVRKALIILSFLLFPITMNYFSPYIIVDGASQGIISRCRKLWDAGQFRRLG